MLNKITEPQAQYTKAPTPGQPAHTSFTTPPKKPSKLNWKIVSGIVTVSLVAIVGIAGILIAQRQQADQSPVAPNAPESQPQAAIDPIPQCSLIFSVGAPPPPPPPPSTGTAKCISKTAQLVNTTTGAKTPLTANSKVKRGDTIEYAVTLSHKTDTEAATIIDVLPSALEFVNNSAKVNGNEVDPTYSLLTNTVTYGLNIPDGHTGNYVYTYQTRVKQSAPIANFTNAVRIAFNGDHQNPDTSCKITLGIEAPPSGVASCVSKTAYKGDTTTTFGSGATPALAKRGEVIRYQIIVKANALTSGPVEIKDVLPDTLTYQPGSARIGIKAPTATEFTQTGQTLTFKPGVMASQVNNRELVFTYKATVKTDAAVAPFKNTVTTSTNGVAAAPAAACAVNLQVAPVGVAACQTKEAFTDYGGTKIANESVLEKGTEFVYKLIVAATETTSGDVAVVDTLPSKLEFVGSKDNTLQHSNGRLTATIPQFGTTPADRTRVFEYKVRVKDDAGPGKFENGVTVTTANNTAQADSCKLTLHVPYQCNSDCTTDAQCNNNGSSTSYICSEEAGNKCRRASNPDSASCSSTETEYTCNSSCDSNSQCQQEDEDYICEPTSEGDRCRHKDYPTRASCDAPSTPPPTPSIGCNDTCVSNADCSNPSHICYNSGGTQVCRLETNPTSNTCTNPGTPGQPTLPEELPQTGPEDWVNWLKAGLITLGIGAALLLLL